jgi:hypothetical protein
MLVALLSASRDATKGRCRAPLEAAQYSHFSRKSLIDVY